MQTNTVLKNGGWAMVFGLALAGGSPALAADDASTTPPARGWAGHGDGWQHHGWHHHGGPLAAFRQLNLSDSQQASLKAILEAAKPTTHALMQQIHANNTQLRAVTPDDANYAQVVATVAQQNGALMAQLQAQRAQVYAEAYALLDEAQKTQLAGIRTARHPPL
jgi:Spy/CpxP family protein refolding chaperone